MIALKKILVVVADAFQAKFYIAHNPHELTQIDHLQHTESRMSDHTLSTKEHDANTCPYEEQNSIKQHEKDMFAKKIAKTMEKAVEQENLADVYVFAAPHFLGELHKNLDNTHLKITAINKDLVNAEPAQIMKDMQVAGVTFLKE